MSTSAHSSALSAVRARLRALANPAKARILQSFFKTGPGEYGAGDRFLGVQVPPLRRIVRESAPLSLAGALRLLRSPIHEERLVALLFLVRRYQEGDARARAAVYRAYLANARHVNNWDLVDVSAPNIAGEHLLKRSRHPLRRLARSRLLWERRIAIVATLRLIRANDFSETMAIARQLLGDAEDLIHKATGWMLREVGKRDVATLESFLNEHAARMPRTMLRYAIERLPEPGRRAFLSARTPPPATGR
jgi:3-methyladenine DNA glycosylase AlkD